MADQAPATQAVVEAVEHITFGPESTFENLSIVALLGDLVRSPIMRRINRLAAVSATLVRKQAHAHNCLGR